MLTSKTAKNKKTMNHNIKNLENEKNDFFFGKLFFLLNQFAIISKKIAKTSIMYGSKGLVNLIP